VKNGEDSHIKTTYHHRESDDWRPWVKQKLTVVSPILATMRMGQKHEDSSEEVLCSYWSFVVSRCVHATT